jgi:hypothetical protein
MLMTQRRLLGGRRHKADLVDDQEDGPMCFGSL